MPRANPAAVYQGKLATLYLGRCEDVLPQVGGGSLVTDPPYGIAYSHGVGGGCLAKSTVFDDHAIEGDDRPFDPAPLLRFSTVVLWGANHYASRLPSRPAWLVWDKREGMRSNDQADCELAWTSLDGTARLFHHTWNGMLKASERGESRVHPTQKPVALMLWCLQFVPAFDVVIDPYMGSGTTGVAAVRLGRRFVGVECDRGYFGVAVARIREAEGGCERLAPPPRRRMT